MKHKPFELVSRRTFRHPLIKELSHRTEIIGVRADSLLFCEHVVRGDTVEGVFDLDTLWRNSPPTEAWTVTVSSSPLGRRLCTVFGPLGFDFANYAADMALLHLLQINAELVGCEHVLSRWVRISKYLTGTASYTNAAGWIHDTGVAVVSCRMRGAQALRAALLARSGVSEHEVREHFDSEFGLSRAQLFVTASNIIQRALKGV